MRINVKVNRTSHYQLYSIINCIVLRVAVIFNNMQSARKWLSDSQCFDKLIRMELHQQLTEACTVSVSEYSVMVDRSNSHHDCHIETKPHIQHHKKTGPAGGMTFSAGTAGGAV